MTANPELHLDSVHSGLGTGAENPWTPSNHPLVGLTPEQNLQLNRTAAYAPAGNQPGFMSPGGMEIQPGPQTGGMEIPPIFPGQAGAPVEVPAEIQQAIAQGRPIQFSSTGENQAAGQPPDYFLTPDGRLIHNDNAQPSPDGSINIEIQTPQDPQNPNQPDRSLRDAIMHETDMQRQAAKEMIQLFLKDHPGANVPQWMTDLATRHDPGMPPDTSNFVPGPSSPNAPVTPPPENGFSNRGVHGGGGGCNGGGGGGRADAGFANNGGFDSNGMFKGNGSSGDGSLNYGNYSGTGQPLDAGQTVAVKEIYDYMTQQYGLSPAVASGILGNMQTESSFKTNAYNKGEGAIGLCQWEGPRRHALEAFAQQEGKPVTDWHVQVDFMMHELKGGESGAWNRLQAAQTPAQAAAIFDQYYERSSGAARGQRVANANNIHQQIANA
jgi:hypothetical protein